MRWPTFQLCSGDRPATDQDRVSWFGGPHREV